MNLPIKLYYYHLYLPNKTLSYSDKENSTSSISIKTFKNNKKTKTQVGRVIMTHPCTKKLYQIESFDISVTFVFCPVNKKKVFVDFTLKL